MGIDTYLIVPTGTRARAEELVRDHFEEEEDEAQIGEDFVALYQGERFHEVQENPGVWGANYLELIPQEYRAQLDGRGLLVVPEVGQRFDDVSFDELTREHGATWLPLEPPRRRTRCILLVHLSANRQERLRRDPGLVREIVGARGKQPVPDALELGEIWIDLQKLLFDFQWESGTVDALSEALAPKKGLPLYEDRTIDASFLIRADQATATAEWVRGLPRDVVARVRKKNLASPASQAFPASLGPSKADELEELAPKAPARRPAAPKALEAALARVKAFYRLVEEQRCAILAIRFRG